MKAMILAAGEGTRLRPLTLAVPKPMVPILGTPLLEHTLRWLGEQGVTEAAINLYHRPQTIPDYFGTNYQGIRIHYFYEETLRGTAGGVKGAEAILKDAPFYVIYGDNLIRADLRRLKDFHQKHRGIATVALFHHPRPTAAGIVGLDNDGRITRFVEKPPANAVFSDFANAGVYVLDPAVLAHIPSGPPLDFGKDIFPLLLSKDEPMYGTLLGGYLQDTGTPESYRQANWDLLERIPAGDCGISNIWNDPTATVSPSAGLEGHNVLGPGAVVDSGARLRDCILWEGARVGAGAELTDCVLGRHSQVAAGCHVPAGTLLEDNGKFG